MVIDVGLDDRLHSIAAVWDKAKERRRTLVVSPSPEGYRALIEAVGPGEGWTV